MKKLLIILFFVQIYGYTMDVKPNIVISTTAKSIDEIYHPYNYRSPLDESKVYGRTTSNFKINLSTYTSSDFSIDNLVLSGIIKYKTRKEALIKDVSNGEMYILKMGRIYTLKGKILRNIRGWFKGNDVVIIDKETKKTKTLSLKKE